MSSITHLLHHPYIAPSGFEAVAPPVHKASTVIFPNVAAMRSRTWHDKSGYTYGLHGTPTTFTLEARIAALEGATHCVLTPSGLAAILLVNVAMLKAGDEVLLPDNAYGPGQELARHELAQWGIRSRIYDPLDVASLTASLQASTRLVWLEAPGSVTMEFPNLPALVEVCRQRGVTTALDNTWGAGLAFNPFDFGQGWGVDVSIHALTKYPSGGADVLMGSVCTRNDGLHQRIQMAHGRLGLGVGANDVELVLRGLPSVALRYAAQDQAARQLAAYCATLPSVRRVLHPALSQSPGHEHWRALCRGAASLFSVEVQPDVPVAQVDQWVDGLQVFRIGYSWGGPVSLAVPYHAAPMRSLPSPYQGRLIRLAIGLESVEDLQEDIAQAAEAAGLGSKYARS